jgi:uncharacterized protein YecE (DUF72 family)
MTPSRPGREPALFDPPFDDPSAAQADAPAGTVLAAEFDPELVRLGRRLPPGIHLGAASWNHPGWRGLVYGGHYGEAQLLHAGLPAYCRHPLLRSAGLDRAAHRGTAAADLQQDLSHYAQQVPDDFRFVLRAPPQITDARIHGSGGGINPHFLDAALAAEQFVLPAAEGLGGRTGPVVLQLAPLPTPLARASHELIDRIGAFLGELPRRHEGVEVTYAVEVRDPELLTPRFVHMLRDAGARLCIGIHPRLPPATRQAAALRAMDGLPPEGDNWMLKGPLVVRWSLHSGVGDEQARSRYAPFDRLVDSDIVTRGTLAHLIHIAARSGQSAFVIVDNKAEGCAPLTCVELARALARDEPAR